MWATNLKKDSLRLKLFLANALPSAQGLTSLRVNGKALHVSRLKLVAAYTLK